jgi:hypothetical protein
MIAMKNHLLYGYENIITHNHTKGKGKCRKIQYLSHFSEVKEMRNGYEKGRSGRVVNSNRTIVTVHLPAKPSK